MRRPTNRDYTFWIEYFKGRASPEVVTDYISRIMAFPTPEVISPQMTFKDWLLKSPNFANSTFKDLEKPVWVKICRVLGIVLERTERRNAETLLVRIESERSHINKMLNLPFVGRAIFQAIQERCREELTKGHKPFSHQTAPLPVVIAPDQRDDCALPECVDDLPNSFDDPYGSGDTYDSGDTYGSVDTYENGDFPMSVIVPFCALESRGSFPHGKLNRPFAQ
jgi:hypothetical protein